MTRAITIALLIAALLAATQSEAKRFWLGREGLGMGKLGAAGSQGSNGVAPVTCGNGTINLSTGCPQPMLGGL